MSEQQATSGFLEWLTRNWPILTLLGLGAKNQYDTIRLKKTVFDQEGELKIKRLLDCSGDRGLCQDLLKEKLDDGAEQMKKTAEDISTIQRDLAELTGSFKQFMEDRKHSGGRQ